MWQPTVLLDVDGVLISFIAGALKSMKDLFGIEGKHDDVVTYGFEKCFGLDADQQAKLIHAWMQPGWCAALPPYLGAQAAVATLKQLSIVHPVTMPFPSQTWVIERDAALLEHFGFPRKDVVQTESKHLVVGDVFVDDKPEHVIGWQSKHPQGVGILWAQPYNADAVKPRPSNLANGYAPSTPAWTGLRTNDWNDVIGIVKAMRWIPRKAQR